LVIYIFSDNGKERTMKKPCPQKFYLKSKSNILSEREREREREKPQKLV
jgi:hypothetical protein